MLEGRREWGGQGNGKMGKKKGSPAFSGAQHQKDIEGGKKQTISEKTGTTKKKDS